MLIENGVDLNNHSQSCLGYGQWKGCVQGDISRDAAIELWVTEEGKYMKLQKTWFKKNKKINWFDVSKIGYQKRVEKVTDKWYSSK